MSTASTLTVHRQWCQNSGQPESSCCYGDSAVRPDSLQLQHAQFDEWTRQNRSLIDFLPGNCRTASPESMSEYRGEQGFSFYKVTHKL